MPFFNPQGGAAPGAARNSMANYPPNPATAGFAATKPKVAPPSRYGGTPPPVTATPPAPMGGVTTGLGEATPTFGAGVADGRGFATNGSGAGNVRGGGYEGGGAGEQNVNKQFRQMRRQMDGASMDTTNPTMGEPPPSDAMDEAAAGPDGPNQAWRAARRQANRQGFISQNEDGSYSPVGATPGPGGPPNFATGADRNGMAFRDMRRQAKRQGTFTPPPNKPGQPPAM